MRNKVVQHKWVWLSLGVALLVGAIAVLVKVGGFGALTRTITQESQTAGYGFRFRPVLFVDISLQQIDADLCRNSFTVYNPEVGESSQWITATCTCGLNYRETKYSLADLGRALGEPDNVGEISNQGWHEIRMGGPASLVHGSKVTVRVHLNVDRSQQRSISATPKLEVSIYGPVGSRAFDREDFTEDIFMRIVDVALRERVITLPETESVFAVPGS